MQGPTVLVLVTLDRADAEQLRVFEGLPEDTGGAELAPAIRALVHQHANGIRAWSGRVRRTRMAETIHQRRQAEVQRERCRGAG